MKGDFTRLSHRPSKHFVKVLSQQGRVELDADRNEAADIAAHFQETLVRDAVGAAGAPRKQGAFGVKLTPDGRDLILTEGRFYLDGLVLEVDATELRVKAHATASKIVAPDWIVDGRAFAPGQWMELRLADDTRVQLKIVGATEVDGKAEIDFGSSVAGFFADGPVHARRLATYATQPDHPDAPALAPAPGTSHVVLLEAFQRHVTAIEDPDLREVALGGPDTTTRVRNVWRVKVQGDRPADATCRTDVPGWPPAPGDARLSSFVEPTEPPATACEMPPEGGYTGLENRLYRVEVHQGGDRDHARFKWSRDNGAVVFAVDSEADPAGADKVTLRRLGKDELLTLHRGDRVEITADENELAGEPGDFLEVLHVDDVDAIVRFTTDVPAAWRSRRGVKLRRWDAEPALVKGPVSDGLHTLENGVKIRFHGTLFRPGDWWVFAARTATRGVEELREAPPRGERRRHARLAVIDWSADGSSPRVHDCRKLFDPLTEIRQGCCTLTVGDGVASFGDYTDIQHAIDDAPPNATVCIRPGTYRLRRPLTIHGRANLRLEGCGDGVDVHAPFRSPVLHVHGSDGIEITGISFTTSAHNAVILDRSARVTLRRCTVNNFAQADAEARRLALATEPYRRMVEEARRANPSARPLDESNHDVPTPALFGNETRDVVVEESVLTGPVAIFLQCENLRLRKNLLRGGVILHRGTAHVEILDNAFEGSPGAGVSLGHLFGFEDRTGAQDLDAHLRDVVISGNSIRGCDGSGIATPARAPQAVSVARLAIERNRIVRCAQERLDAKWGKAAGGIAVEGAVEPLVRDNDVHHNGNGRLPACGIYVQGGFGLRASGNRVVGNGVERPGAPTFPNTVDFRGSNDRYYAPPQPIDGIYFDVYQSKEGRYYERVPQTEITTLWDAGKGMNVQDVTVVHLPRPVRKVTLLVSHRGGFVAMAQGGTRATHDGQGVRRITLTATSNRIRRVILMSQTQGNLLHWVQAGTYEPAPMQGGIVVMDVLGGTLTADEMDDRSLTPGAPAAWIHDNLVSTPAGHALLVRAQGPVSIQGNELTSRGIWEHHPDLGLGNVAVVHARGKPRREQYVQVALVRGDDSPPPQPAPPGSAQGEQREPPYRSEWRWPAPDEFPAMSTYTPPEAPVLFAGNQVFLAGTVPEDDVPRGLIYLASLDDVGLDHNQVRSHAGPLEAIDSTATLRAHTTRVASNRVTEPAGTASSSIHVQARYLVVVGNLTSAGLRLEGPQREEAANLNV